MNKSLQKNATDTHVGNKVKLLREIRRVTQADLGKALGVSFQQIQKYERGANRISASKLHQLAQVLQVPPSHFFEGLDQVSVSAPDFGTQFAESSDALALVNAFKRVKSKDMRRAIIAMVTELARAEEE
jgi:transcriptional regulator with XRE-family HTH domain